MLARSGTNAQALVKPTRGPGVLVRFGQGRGACLIRRSPGRNWLGQSGPGPEWSPAQLSALPLTCGSEKRPYSAGLRDQPQSITEVRAKQALTGDCLGPGTNDVGELRYRKQSLADISIADVVGQDIDSKRIDRAKRVADLGHRTLPLPGIPRNRELIPSG